MPNFYSDNEDLVWQMRNLDLSEIIQLREPGFAEAEECPYAPTSVEDALDSYQRVLGLMGDICGNFIAPRATDVDREGCTLVDGEVVLAPGTRENLKALTDADLMGYTLPRKYGGLNLPSTMYCAANEMISRADAGLMTLFGLQDIAETIKAFADEDQKDRYLPRMASGELSGAMVLTEPDAGSDLQACRLRAYQDENGDWRLHGVKRFISNGCGDVLLVLSRSEEGSKDGRGLSLFVCMKGPGVVIQRIEDKLGIHGSPTCQMYFDHVKCELIGQRRRGLITYVMALMNGARVSIASQGVGISEAAYRAALAYAVEREQFGKPIFDIPAVSDMLVDMKVGVETSRSLLYECARAVDMEEGLSHVVGAMDRKDPAFKDTRKRLAASRKLAGVLTPLAKYYCCETCIRIASDNIQIHGGSGFMRDYEAERYWRDARITTIYEGTTELQAVAILAGLMGGALTDYLAERAARSYEGEVAELRDKVNQIGAFLEGGLDHCRERGDSDYTSAMGKRLSDMAAYVVIGHLLLHEATQSERKLVIARRFIGQALLKARAAHDGVLADDDTGVHGYRELLAGDVPKG